MKKAIFLMLLTSLSVWATNVNIKVTPTDSKIFINEVAVKGVIPKKGLKIDLKEGHYHIVVTRNNYLSKELDFWLTDKGESFNIKLTAHKIDFKINSNTPNSTIKVNGRIIDKRVPLVFYDNGEVTIEESLKGYKSTTKKLNLELGNTYLVDLPKLEALKTSLTVSGNLPTTSIRLDGKLIGEGSLLGYNNASHGKHHLTLINPGYKTYDTDIVLSEVPVKVDYKLIKIEPKYLLGVGASYGYSYKIGGIPEFNLSLILDKTKIKLDLFYIINPSTNLEYHGFAIGGQYRLYRKDFFSFYLGADLLLSKLIDSKKTYNQYAVGLNAVASFKILEDLPLYIDLDLTNRVHYLEEDLYNIYGKLSLTYLF